MTKDEVLAVHPARFEATPANIAIAQGVVQRLWNERQLERDQPVTKDRSGSCKFAALLARALFGGRIAGNSQHVYVKLGRRIIDLNEGQFDVESIGAERAHADLPRFVANHEHRESLASCMSRVNAWLPVAIAELNEALVPARPRHRKATQPEAAVAP